PALAPVAHSPLHCACSFSTYSSGDPPALHSFPTRRSSDLTGMTCGHCENAVREEVSEIAGVQNVDVSAETGKLTITSANPLAARSEEHTSELQSRFDLVCRLLLEKKKIKS